jgi:PAS domain S-box-containing protein
LIDVNLGLIYNQFTQALFLDKFILGLRWAGMTWNYAYTPQIWPPVFTVVVLIALAVYSYRRRSVPGALPFTFALLFGALWAAGYVLEYLAVDLAAKITWVKFQMAWQLPSATAVAFFLLEYAWPGRWLTRRNLALLSIVPLLVILLILTDHLHHLVWRGFVFNKTVTPLLGPLGWIAIVYAYSFTVINFIVFAWLFIHSPQHRWAVVLIVISQIFLRAAYLLEKTQTLQSDLVVIGMAFVCLMYTVALFPFHLLSPLPLARQKVIDQMREGMLVLDTEGRVAGLNPAAAAILGLAEEQARGRPLQEVLPSYPPLQDGSLREAEISLGTGPGARAYLLATSSLKDWRGQNAGRLLLLHDVTEQRRFQAQILEQQRVVATLSERERLARELHDSLGQVLGFASLKLGAARKLAADGKLEKADDQMAHLESILSDAHADVREYILNLRTAPSSDQPFFDTVRHYLDGFRQNYGIQVLLNVADDLSQSPIPAEAQMQVFRILQEALSNARKHGQARCVQVSFAAQDGLVRMVIQDDGQGFDATQPEREGHYGLKFMRERAEQSGGRLEVNSAPGKGTLVEVEIPVSSEQ